MTKDITADPQTRQKNKELCDRYPFLIPSNRWSGKRINDAKDGGYWPGNPEAIPEPWDYEYTELDEMPEGWRKAFGEQLCEDLRQELLRSGGELALNLYRIVEVKEKFGQLRFYDNGCTERWYHEILPKYEKLSWRTCIRCGKPATKISCGWISPYCDDCAAELEKKYHTTFEPIDGDDDDDSPDEPI